MIAQRRNVTHTTFADGSDALRELPTRAHSLRDPSRRLSIRGDAPESLETLSRIVQCDDVS
jgi:hypothetical protein